MTEQLLLDDFSAGWCPSDDPLNGRKNGLMAMENVTLDVNGRLTSSGGTSRKLSVFSNTAHSLYSKVINGTNYIYSADTSGNVFRDTTNIKTGGSTTKAAFGAAFNYVFGFSGDNRFKDTGAAVTDLGIIKPSAAPTVGIAVIGAPAVLLTGDYEYCQINVFKNGTYRAKSARSAISTVSPAGQNISITPQDPAVPGSTANEVWIFRRGVLLDTWYRIAVRTSYGAFGDTVSDIDALALGITMNDFLLSVNSTDTPDAIIAVVGPIYGRFVYFTKTQIIFSDRYSPDSYDSRTPIDIGSAASGAENFKWAIKVNKNSVLVGTDLDVYLLSGTFVQLPDGFLDVSLDPLGVSDPPIGTDVTLYQSSAVYMSRVGWVACPLSGNIVNLCFPNTDYLYSGGSNYEYGPVTIDTTGATRYACTISKGKLYTIETLGVDQLSVTTGIHMEVYDFQRKYWRVAYPAKCPLMLYTMENSQVIGFDNTDKFIKQYDVPGVYTLADGFSTKQAIKIYTNLLDDGKPNNLKELFSLLVSGGTNSGINGIVINVNINGHVGLDNVFTTTFLQDNTGYYSVDFTKHARDGADPDTPIIAKKFQIQITGTPNRLMLQSLLFTYDLKPESHTRLKLYDLGFTSPEKKRLRALPLIIDVHDGSVGFYLYGDGNQISFDSFSGVDSNIITTHYIGTDVFASHYTAEFVADSEQVPFELYKILPPDIVQTLPPGRKFDQVGPIELFRYGKLKEIEFRIINFINGGGASELNIPYTIYMEDTSILTGTFATISGKEEVYHIDFPKTIAGTILRIELGPMPNAVFHRISTRIKVTKSGGQTEEQWITLDDNK